MASQNPPPPTYEECMTAAVHALFDARDEMQRDLNLAANPAA